MAKKQFTNLNNDYELTLERDTVIEKAEDQQSVPQIRFNFTSIGDLASVEKDTTIDCIGILKEIGETSEIVSKTTSKPYSKRELTIVDTSMHQIRLTIWGNTATSFAAEPESVIAFKGLKVSDFGGRSLSLLSSGTMTMDPDIDEAYQLKGWYDAQSGRNDFLTHNNIETGGSLTGRKDDTKTIGAVIDEGLGMSTEKPDYFSIRATVVYVKQDNFAYPACISENCNKKVVEIDPGQWRCEKCDKTHDRPQYRYVLTISVSDHTGQVYLSLFDDAGKAIMDMDADTLYRLKDEDERAATEAFSEANCKTWVFRIKAKMDTFNDQQR